MERIVGCMIGLVLLAAACGSGAESSPDGSPSTSDGPTADSSSGSFEPLDGVWRQDYSCEQSVRTFHRLTYQHGAEGHTRYKRYVVHDGFAWGRKGATELTPEALCRGAHDRYLLMKVGDGRLTFFDGPAHEADLQASIVILSDHTFTLNDGDQNLGGTEAFSYRIRGDRLTVHALGDDEWSGTAFERAAFVRVS
jgi:hypothetical protein